MTDDKITVLFIGGTGRTGSTILEQVLSQNKAIFGAGELVHIWGKGFRTNQLCACRKPFHECAFWQSIIGKIKKKYSKNQLKKVETLLWEIESPWNIPKLIYPSLRRNHFHEKLNKHKNHTMELFDVIAKKTSSKIIIDSSKLPQRGFLLGTMDHINLYVLHLIRDPRGVSYSWTKKKKRPEVYWKEEYLEQKSIFKSSRNWILKNLLIEWLGRIQGNYLRIHYEDFVQSTQKVRDKIFRFIDVSQPTMNSRATSDYHSISGNPLRLNKQNFELKIDSEWKKKLSFYEKLTISTLTAPVSFKYNYPYISIN